MKVGYRRLCYRASDNPGFIWNSDFRAAWWSTKEKSIEPTYPTCVLAARMLQSILRASITYHLEDGNVLTWVDFVGIVIRVTPPLRSNFCLALVWNRLEFDLGGNVSKHLSTVSGYLWGASVNSQRKQYYAATKILTLWKHIEKSWNTMPAQSFVTLHTRRNISYAVARPLGHGARYNVACSVSSTWGLNCILASALLIL